MSLLNTVSNVNINVAMVGGLFSVRDYGSRSGAMMSVSRMEKNNEL